MADKVARQQVGKVALVYVRVSRLKEEEERAKVSPQMQLARCAALPALHGLRVEKFEDLDFSGKTTERPGFRALMARAKQGDVAVVACYSLSRLSRSVRDLYDTLQQLEKAGVAFVSATESVDTASAVGRMFMGILAVLAQFERELLVERVTDGLHTLMAKGKLLGHAPVGYRRVKGALELDPESAAIVRQAFDLYATGRFSVQGLANHLNAAGLPVPLNRDLPRPRRKWSRALLQGMLFNPSYLGKIKINGALRPGNHPALVEKAVFDQCNAVRDRNKRRRTHYRHHRNAYPLVGIAICARCGGKLQGRRRPELGYHWYRCANRPSGACDLPRIRGSVVEDAIGADLQRYVDGDGKDARLVERLRAGLAKAPERNLQQTLKALDARAGRILYMYEQGDIDQADYMERMARVNLEKQAAREQGKEQAEADLRWAAERIVNVWHEWEKASAEEKTLLVADVYHSLEVDYTVNGIEVVAVPNPRWRPFFARVIKVRSEVGGKGFTSTVGVGNLAAQPV